MSTIEILTDLHPFLQFLTELHGQEFSHQKEESATARLTKQLSREYNFITLQLKKQESEIEPENQVLYCKITFDVADTKKLIHEVYCADVDRLRAIEDLIQQNTSALVNRTSTIGAFSVLKQYLTIADSIASVAKNCTAGDSYEPGYFSKITVTDERIILTQNNSMNARSLDHKNNYSLRALQFSIPLTTRQDTARFFDDQIGDMLITFSDRSSANNRKYGDAIADQIQKEKMAFEAR
jgi:hypothetical protein